MHCRSASAGTADKQPTVLSESVWRRKICPLVNTSNGVTSCFGSSSQSRINDRLPCSRVRSRELTVVCVVATALAVVFWSGVPFASNVGSGGEVDRETPSQNMVLLLLGLDDIFVSAGTAC